MKSALLEGAMAPIPSEKLPRHVAIIMDGNGRWAKKHKVQIALGHRNGVEALRDVIRESSDLGLYALSIYAFSTENWSRSTDEVGALMQLLLEFFEKEIDELDRKNVCIRILGDVEGLPSPQREAVKRAMERTKENTGLHLNIALNYGGRAELLTAVKTISQKVKDGVLSPEEITANTLEEALTTHGMPDVDLLIRTSGEMRLSNFLLYQCAYAEFMFSIGSVAGFLPSGIIEKALQAYAGRERRFGGRK